MGDIDLKSVRGLNSYETALLYDEIFVRRSYWPDEVSLPEDATVFDVGANIGMFALFIARERPRARIFAFEPVPDIYEVLSENLRIHGVRARSFPFGLSDRNGAETFTYYAGYSTMSGQSRYADTEDDVRLVKQVAIDASPDVSVGTAAMLEDLVRQRFQESARPSRVCTLSSIIDLHMIERIDLLKIDVQRAEADVLAGIRESHWPRIRQIVMEVHDDRRSQPDGRLAAIREALGDRGFRVRSWQDADLTGSDRHNLSACR